MQHTQIWDGSSSLILASTETASGRRRDETVGGGRVAAGICDEDVGVTVAREPPIDFSARPFSA